jgi:hypothetical protein
MLSGIPTIDPSSGGDIGTDSSMIGVAAIEPLSGAGEEAKQHAEDDMVIIAARSIIFFIF